MVQIRYCLYLDPDDYGYDKHYVEVPIIPEEGYQGKVGEMGVPIDQDDYDKWFSELPTEMQNNPFHNHFVQVEPDITDAEILYIGEVALIEAKRKWDKDEKVLVKNEPFQRIEFPTVERLSECQDKLDDIKSKDLKKDKVIDKWQT